LKNENHSKTLNWRLIDARKKVSQTAITDSLMHAKKKESKSGRQKKVSKSGTFHLEQLSFLFE